MLTESQQHRSERKHGAPVITIVVPLYNEETNIPFLFRELCRALEPLPYQWHVLFINDGSTDNTAAILDRLAGAYEEIHFIELSRNFGKETATTVGLHVATGDAVICIDADLQHPPSLIPEFIEKWEQGAEVVVGVRKKSRSDSYIKRMGSYCFYKIMNLISETEIVPRATDFRLLDRIVVNAFRTLTEHNRMTRGLIDWLGFKREYIHFDASMRLNGIASYRPVKLLKLALATFISHSLLPLKLAGYLGVTIVFLSGILGMVMILDRYVTDWGLHFSGPAMLADIILFLVGVVLISIGLLAFYIAHIHQETQGRPLYVIRRSHLREEEKQEYTRPLLQEYVHSHSV